jgi:hypothetical protein
MRLDKVDIEKFMIAGYPPLQNYKFFCQHLAPYVFFKKFLGPGTDGILEVGK